MSQVSQALRLVKTEDGIKVKAEILGLAETLMKKWLETIITLGSPEKQNQK